MRLLALPTPFRRFRRPCSRSRRCHRSAFVLDDRGGAWCWQHLDERFKRGLRLRASLHQDRAADRALRALDEGAAG